MGFFLSEFPPNAPSVVSNTPRWYFGLLQNIQWRGCSLDPKNLRRVMFQRNFALGIFWSGWAAIPPLHWLLLCLGSYWHNQVSSMVTNRDGHFFWIAPRNFQNLLRQLEPLKFLISVQAFRDPLRGELPDVQMFMNDGSKPLTWDSQLLSYWFSWNPLSSKISLWISSIAYGLVTALSRPGLGVSRVENYHV